MILDGYVKNKDGLPVEYATVEIKDEKFVTIYTTESNTEGYYRFDIPAGEYPFLTAVKDYKESSLEYWCRNIPLYEDVRLDVSFDTLEVYGIHVFHVKGGGKSLMVYFRPMSLEKYKNGYTDISPDGITIRAFVDGGEREIININKVSEKVAEDMNLTAYLVQVRTNRYNEQWKKLEIQIKDIYGNYGAAAIFCNKE